MLIGALLTIVAILVLIWKMGTVFRQLVLGYDVAADIIVTALLISMFASTGTISGMMISIIAGLAFSIVLLVAKKISTSRTLRITRDGMSFDYEWVITEGALGEHSYLRRKLNSYRRQHHASR